MAVPSEVKKPLVLDFGVDAVDSVLPERDLDICAGNKLGAPKVEAATGCCSAGFENRLPNSAAAPLCGAAVPLSTTRPIGDDADRLCPAEATRRNWCPGLPEIVDRSGEVFMLNKGGGRL